MPGVLLSNDAAEIPDYSRRTLTAEGIDQATVALNPTANGINTQIVRTLETLMERRIADPSTALGSGPKILLRLEDFGRKAIKSQLLLRHCLMAREASTRQEEQLQRERRRSVGKLALRLSRSNRPWPLQTKD